MTWVLVTAIVISISSVPNRRQYKHMLQFMFLSSAITETGHGYLHDLML